MDSASRETQSSSTASTVAGADNDCGWRPLDELDGDAWFSLPISAYDNHRGDWEIALTKPGVLGLAAFDDTGEIVRLLRPSRPIPNAQDFWVVSFARDLMRVK